METHYICKHSDVYNFCCGNCVKVLLQEQRLRIAKEIKEMIKPVSKEDKDNGWEEFYNGYNESLQTALNIVLEDK